ncbi:MAG TPA: hypothetical protein VK935_06580 [Actinomycetospora sp.]|nr:hypothetical protein [Actinomycetospora sp.]
MIPFLLGTGVGYVLGTRAGRERYEQLSRAYRRVADHPSVQGAAGVARAKAGEAVQTGVSIAKDKVQSTGGSSSGASSSGGGAPSAPGRAAANGAHSSER